MELQSCSDKKKMNHPLTVTIVLTLCRPSKANTDKTYSESLRMSGTFANDKLPSELIRNNPSISPSIIYNSAMFVDVTS